jgi:His-Xaa-Ser system radical SAM maturase HxsB
MHASGGQERIDVEELPPAGLPGVAASVLPISHSELRSRVLPGLGEIVADAAGRFALVDAGPHARLSEPEAWSNFAETCGLNFGPNDHLERLSGRVRQLARQAKPGQLDYLILVPTLRCNLSCSYCQVSRAPETASGFDWSEEVVAAIEELLDGLETRHIKIEFQGGEPSLRMDLVDRIIDRCERFPERSFVLCSNLAVLDDKLLRLLERDDVTISTSLDGDWHTHRQQRTQSDEATGTVHANIERIIAEFGSDKISALPTIDQANPPKPDDLIDAYAAFGFTSIFLRPINFQGFARKRHQQSARDHIAWWDYHEAFLRRLIERNYADRSVVLEESYFSLCLRRIFRPGLDRHVDLRNPNPIGRDYLVVDYDGSFYPSDEARMLTRSGVVDLAMGHVQHGVDEEKRQLLDTHSTSFGDPACDTCVYQAYCGRDIVDDLSRYGRIDLPRENTFFCQKHLSMFDLAMRLIHSEESSVQYSLAKWLGLAGERLPPLPRFA